MPIESTNNIVFDFLTEPRFRIGRHMLLILMLIGYAVGQSMYVFDNHTGKLGWVSYVYTASLAVVYIVLTYIIIYLLAPHFLARNKVLSFFVVLLGSILFLVAAKNMIEYNLSLYLGIAYPINGATLLNYITEIIHTTICVSSSMIPFLLRMWTADSKRIVDIEGQRLKSSIEEFKEQINPDFLFNIIQYASEEVKREPRKASDAIMCLSDLLRYELYDCKRAKVILKSDIDFVRNYLSLVQQVADNFSYSISVEGNPNWLVHPFIFMPFIRNILSQRPDDISLYYKIDKSTITLICKNEDGLLESSTINYKQTNEK